jgi:EAL domain
VALRPPAQAFIRFHHAAPRFGRDATRNLVRSRSAARGPGIGDDRGPRRPGLPPSNSYPSATNAASRPRCPQVDLESDRIIGVEALVRWRHPTRGVLLPGVFIPAAERAGLIAPLGKWVLAEACHQARRWLDEGIAPDHLGVNFSSLPGQLEKEIDAVLGETGLPTNMLELECVADERLAQ